MSIRRRLPTFRPEAAEVVVPAPGRGPGWWAGAPAAAVDHGTVYLAYRVRVPERAGRGVTTVVARSEDGLVFETVAAVDAERLGAASLERPALVHMPDGAWRLYVSCATPGTKHWRIEALEAPTPELLGSRPARTVLPGDENHGVKDPVIKRIEGRWHMWFCAHPLADAAHTDRMSSEHATSDDGLTWHVEGPALVPTPETWDARGTRITEILLDGGAPIALYDGRPTADANFEEQTGYAVAAGGPDEFTSAGQAPIGTSPEGGGGLRYACVAHLGDGPRRLYYELSRADGSHDLVTQLA